MQQQQNEFLVKILDRLPDSIIVTDEQGVITGWLAASETIFGYSVKTAMKKKNIRFPG